MGKQTPLYTAHLKSAAKIVDFAGWDMPLHYGSQLEEHKKVREKVGMFDVSHMGIVDLQGESAAIFLRQLLANNVDRLDSGKALYSCMLNERGGVIDDLIVYKITDNHFRIVINAGTRDKDLLWIRNQAKKYPVSIHERTDLAMIAVQGPEAKTKVAEIFSSAKEKLKDLKPFHFLQFSFQNLGEIFIARTGYTGEDGFEIILADDKSQALWTQLLAHEVAPCGLGARDTLRLEAGLNLYGSDMDENTTPLESNLAWTVAMSPSDRDFIGRKMLEQNGAHKKLVGLVLNGPGIMRNHQKVYAHEEICGEITSGGFSPSLGKSIALARLKEPIETTCSVEIRNKRVPAQIIKPPFIRKGKPNF